MEGGGHRFPSRLLVPSLFPPFLHLHHLPENLQVPRESPIKSAAAGGGGGRCSLSTPGSQQALQSGCTEAGRAGSPGGRGGKVSGIEACSPGDSKTHLQGLLPTDSHLPADAFDQIGTRPGPDRDRIRLWEGLSVALPPHHSMDRLPAALFLLSHVPTETPSGLSRPVLQVQVCGSVFKAPPADADHPRPTPLPTPSYVIRPMHVLTLLRHTCQPWRWPPRRAASPLQVSLALRGLRPWERESPWCMRAFSPDPVQPATLRCPLPRVKLPRTSLVFRPELVSSAGILDL